MSERYYLLRNNRESGPCSLGELLQQCLLPGDLVWVEGKSQNWMHPSDIPEIAAALPKGYSLSPDEPAAAPFTHVSDQEHALRAESIRRRAMAALYRQEPPLHQGTPRPEMPGGAYLRDEDAIEIVQHKPYTSKSLVGEFALFCTLSALVVVGWRSGVFAHLIQVRQPEPTEATRLVNESSNAAIALPVAKPVAAPADTASQLPVTDSAALNTPAPEMTASAHPRPATTRFTTDSGQLTDSGAAPQRSAGSSEHGASAQQQPGGTTKAAAADAEAKRETPKTTTPAAPEKEQEAPAATKEPVQKPATTAANGEVKEEKHKSFGQVLRGIFKKKKKEEPAAETTPSGN